MTKKPPPGPPIHPVKSKMPVFYERLNHLLNLEGWGARTNLIHKTGICANTIYNCQTGKHIPLLSVALAIAETYDVSLDWLAGRTDKQEVNR